MLSLELVAYESGRKDSFDCILNPYTPKSDQLPFSLSVSHQKYTIQ